MRARFLIAPVVITSVAALTLTAAADDREEMKKKFNAIVTANKGGGKGPGILTPGGKRDNVENVVKLWGELAAPKPGANRNDEANFQPTGTYVSLTEHRWKEGDAFYLYFQSGISVRYALYNVAVKPDGTREAVKPPVLPDEKYEETARPIPVGAMTRLPFPLFTEGPKTEVIWLLFAENGDPRLPAPPMGGTRPNVGVLAKKLNDIGDQARKDRAMFAGLLVRPPKTVAKNVDEVASYAELTKTDTSAGLSGLLEIELKRPE